MTGIRKLGMRSLGWSAGRSLAAAFLAGVIVWHAADQTMAQTTRSMAVTHGTLPGGATGDSDHEGATGSSGPGGQAATTDAPLPTDGIPASVGAVPQGTDMTSEELRRLKEAAERTPGSTADVETQTDPAGN